jgi:hypothetical protein
MWCASACRATFSGTRPPLRHPAVAPLNLLPATSRRLRCSHSVLTQRCLSNRSRDDLKSVSCCRTARFLTCCYRRTAVRWSPQSALCLWGIERSEPERNEHPTIRGPAACTNAPSSRRWRKSCASIARSLFCARAKLFSRTSRSSPYRQRTLCPPSTVNTVPVVKLDADDARYKTAPTISSASPTRPSGT